MTVADRIYDLIVHFVKPLDKLNNLPTIIQGIGIALLTILIPLAIAVLADIYQKRREEKREFTDLDLHLILDSVFNIRLIILSVFLIFFPIFFWEILTGIDRLITVNIIFIGILLVIKIITNIYYWIKGNVFDFRFFYLRKLKNYNDLEIVWSSIWQVENINIQNERKFYQIFSSTINRLLNLTEKSENLKTISKLLNDFYNFINNRSIAALNEDIFPKILDWHFKIWQKKYKLLGKKDKLSERSNYNEILRILNDIVSNIEERSLKEKMAYSFFEHFEKHTEHYKKKLVENNKKRYYYRNSLFSIFCRVFFENVVKSPEKYDIWEDYFPEGWKIKKSNYEKNIITRELCNKFLQWARDIVLSDKKELARDLGDISSNLFPEVEPSLWIAILLLFVYSRYKDNRMKMKSLIEIEHSWDFGPIWRVRIRGLSISNGESIRKMDEVMQVIDEAETKNTFELAFQLFKEQFSKENLEKYLKSLRELEPEYKEEPEKEKKRLYLLYAFNKMLKFLIKQNDNII